MRRDFLWRMNLCATFAAKMAIFRILKMTFRAFHIPCSLLLNDKKISTYEKIVKFNNGTINNGIKSSRNGVGS
jgi:hypothetical protein